MIGNIKYIFYIGRLGQNLRGKVMRVQVSFDTNEIPIAYNMLVVSLIKEALKRSDSNYYKKLFNYKGKKNKKSKNYCFSLDLKNYEIVNHNFMIKGGVIVNFSSPDNEFTFNLCNGLKEINNFKYRVYSLLRKAIVEIKEKKIEDRKVMFETLSPIYIKNKEGIHLSPESESFERELNYISNIILNNYRNYGLREPLYFKSIDMKKRVVKEYVRDFKKITGRKYMYINAYAGRFLLEGDKDDLNDLYKLGISFRRNQGFGMLEVIN